LEKISVKNFNKKIGVKKIWRKKRRALTTDRDFHGNFVSKSKFCMKARKLRQQKFSIFDFWPKLCIVEH